MALYDKPNLLSLIILGVVVAVAATFGLVTYKQRPETAHFDVNPDYEFAFDFDNISVIVDLNKHLKEISGMAPSFAGGDLLYGVQDEDGILFSINARTGDSEEIFKFGKDRDYEGVARTDTAIYVLEQDGDLFEIRYPIPTNDDYEAEKIETQFSYVNNTEGVSFDRGEGALLIVPKERQLNPGDTDSRHGIYRFDLKSKRLNQRPEYYVDEYELGQAVYGKLSRYNLKPSGIAVDPLTDDIFVLAHVGKVLVIINRESEIQHVEILDDNIFQQPEGITFNEAGDLFISSEGKSGKAVVATFRRRAGTPSAEGEIKNDGNE